jgi:hypothetical protein
VSRFLRACAALLLGLGAGALLVVGAASPASACSCAIGAASQRAEADALLADADAVFTGRLVGRQDPISFLGASGSGDLATLTFAVSRVYKGDVAPRQQVRTAQSGASCGLELSGEGPFLLFAQRDAASGGILLASLCGGATPQVDLATWPGAPPDAAVDGSPGPQPPSVAGVAAAAVAVVTLTAGLLVVLLRRGRRRRPE